MVHTAHPDAKWKCKKCSSSCIDVYEHERKKYISCLDCGHEEEITELL